MFWDWDLKNIFFLKIHNLTKMSDLDVSSDDFNFKVINSLQVNFKIINT